MADLKISQLTGATTPLAGAEVVPLVQSSSTKKVAVSDLTAGRTVAVKNLTTSLANSNDIVKLERTGSNPGSGFIFANDTNMFGVQDGSRYPFLVAQGAGTGSLVVDSSSNVNFGNGNLVQGTAAKGVNFTANTPAAGMTSQLLNWYEEGTWTPTGFGGTVTGTFSATGRYTRIGRQVTVSAKLSATTSVSIVAGQTLVNNLPYSAAVESTGVTVRGDVAEYAGNICSGAIVYSAGTVGANANMYFSITYTV